MYTIIILAIIGYLVYFILYIKSEGIYDISDFFEAGTLSLFAGVIFGFFGLFVGFMIPSNTERKVTRSYNLELIKDNSSVNGVFFLGSGSSNGVMQYVYYYEEDGFYKMEQINYSLAKIKYSNEKPKVEVIETVDCGDFINNFAIYFKKSDEYVFYIPQGSIKQDYQLDAE